METIITIILTLFLIGFVLSYAIPVLFMIISAIYYLCTTIYESEEVRTVVAVIFILGFLYYIFV